MEIDMGWFDNALDYAKEKAAQLEAYRAENQKKLDNGTSIYDNVINTVSEGYNDARDYVGGLADKYNTAMADIQAQRNTAVEERLKEQAAANAARQLSPEAELAADLQGMQDQSALMMVNPAGKAMAEAAGVKIADVGGDVARLARVKQGNLKVPTNDIVAATEATLAKQAALEKAIARENMMERIENGLAWTEADAISKARMELMRRQGLI